MKNTNDSKLLGQTLKRAGLISLAQIQVALTDQEYNHQMRLGEILALRGWIKQSTADFFADEWYLLVKRLERYPLGYYLTEADLIDISQVNAVLQEQKQLWIKFGTVAVIKGFIQQKTLDFFLNSLFPMTLLEAPTIGAKSIKHQLNCVTNTASNSKQTVKTEIDYDDIPWVD